MAGDGDVLNIHEAAAFLGAHPQTVRKLARANKIPCFKVGKDWRFRKEALIQWADGQGTRTEAEPGCSVLIIDDEETVCQALARMVARFGCRSRQTTSGKEGLEMVAEQAPDVILLDLQMPGMNGPEVLAALREIHPALPVVVVTGFPESHLVQQAMDHAPVMMLAKPVNRELLERTVRSVVGARKPEATGVRVE